MSEIGEESREGRGRVVQKKIYRKLCQFVRWGRTQNGGWFPSYYRKLGDIFRVRRIVKSRAVEKELHDARLGLPVRTTGWYLG